MDLFSSELPRNILPFDGEALYYGPIVPLSQAAAFLSALLDTIPWRNDEVILFGKRIVTKRKTAWFGDQPFAYTYSRIERTALPWTNELLELKTLVETASGVNCNSCLLNLYHDGNEGMSWHSDDERELEHHGAIASLSLGADRRFLFRHKASGETAEVLLENGSLLVMKGSTQTHWLHRLPVSKKIREPRINLTFRTIRIAGL